MLFRQRKDHIPMIDYIGKLKRHDIKQVHKKHIPHRANLRETLKQAGYLAVSELVAAFPINLCNGIGDAQ